MCKNSSSFARSVFIIFISCEQSPWRDTWRPWAGCYLGSQGAHYHTDSALVRIPALTGHSHPNNNGPLGVSRIVPIHFSLLYWFAGFDSILLSRYSTLAAHPVCLARPPLYYPARGPVSSVSGGRDKITTYRV